MVLKQFRVTVRGKVDAVTFASHNEDANDEDNGRGIGTMIRMFHYRGLGLGGGNCYSHSQNEYTQFTKEV